MVPEDVARALSQHLAEYSQIVHIKVTTDKKGGILPSRPAYPNSGFDASDDPDPTNDSLPQAMRIVRLPHAKCKFLWDTSALEYDESLHGVEQLAIGDNVASKNVLYHPLKFDATMFLVVNKLVFPNIPDLEPPIWSAEFGKSNGNKEKIVQQPYRYDQL
ncbi:hypothetical protein EIP86_004542 [Pleurotus ostreatoroseus]|nr:hypothetical protein EIP86_004542 [Pleurotus ostreatoroseus]